MRFLVLLSALLLAVAGCDRFEAPSVIPAVVTKENQLTGTEWCRADHTDQVQYFTRFNFNLVPNSPTSTFTKDIILDRGDGSVRIFKGETTTPWTFKNELASKGNALEADPVEVVTDPTAVKQITESTKVKFLDGKPATAVLNFISKSQPSYAFPCSSLINTSSASFGSFAEFQLLLGTQAHSEGYDSYEYDRTKAFWKAMRLEAPIQEMLSPSDELSKNDWCLWNASRGSDNQISSRVVVLVFEPSGKMSEQSYGAFFETSTANVDAVAVYRDRAAYYSRDAEKAVISQWKIQEKSKRVVSEPIDETSTFASTYKLIKDREGRTALFRIYSKSPDDPLSVSPDQIFYNCKDETPFEFEKGWRDWLGFITTEQRAFLETKKK